MSTNKLPTDAQILPFYLASGSNDGTLIRGRIASVGQPVSTILKRHNYPKIVSILQAEALALSACLSSTLKFDGVFTLQAKGNGLVRTLFADITTNGDLRGYASIDDNVGAFRKVSDGHDLDGSVELRPILGEGYIAFTVDQGSIGGRYQGIVELDHRYLSDAAMRWYENSEQLDTIVICAAAERHEGWRAVALMLQRIADDGGYSEKKLCTDVMQAKSDDAWHTAKTLLASITRKEILDSALSPENIVFRLFNSMAPHSAPARPVNDRCRCDVEKVESMLQQFSEEEIMDLADGHGNLVITCEFCKISRTVHHSVI